MTDVLKPLQEAGLVRSHRGRIMILDRSRLEDRTCECYQAVKNEYDRLLGSSRAARLFERGPKMYPAG